MKKQNPHQQLKTPTRWICIGAIVSSVKTKPDRSVKALSTALKQTRIRTVKQDVLITPLNELFPQPDDDTALMSY